MIIILVHAICCTNNQVTHTYIDAICTADVTLPLHCLIAASEASSFHPNAPAYTNSINVSMCDLVVRTTYSMYKNDNHMNICDS